MSPNKISQMLFIGIAIIFFACKPSHSCDGTYEGIIPAADCPGIYMLLAIDGDSYELMEKYVTRFETYVTYGTVETTEGNGTLRLDNGMELKLSNGNMQCGDQILNYFSSDKQLPDIYTQVYLKEYQTGEDATFKLYEKNHQRYAELKFREKTHILTLNANDPAADEYANDCKSLKILPETELHYLHRKLFFNDGTDIYTFVQVGPTNCLYKRMEKETDDVPLLWDALYYNDGKQAFVKLIPATSGDCYTLPLTEASAKTATYADSTAEWQLDNRKNGILTVHGKKHIYAENK